MWEINSLYGVDGASCATKLTVTVTVNTHTVLFVTILVNTKTFWWHLVISYTWLCRVCISPFAIVVLSLIDTLYTL